MPDDSLSNSKIIAAYRERTRRSEDLAAEANDILPSGITHDARYVKPYGIYVERAKGPRKWDVDGNEYVDYFGGHGALLLGHNNPPVMAAMHETLDRGTHFGSNHVGEVRWGEVVRRLIPSAERVRFTSSGTEATLMAVRLARAFTGKTKLVRFLTNFHGWHDHMTAGVAAHFDGSATSGVIAGIAAQTILLPPGDIAAMRAALAGDDDIAAVIIEPTGASFGMVPLAPDFLVALREATTQRGIVLIFDEVITGFRASKGGAQLEYGVTPDLTALAKILAGGLPGGAVAGRKAIRDELDFAVAASKGREKIAHPGTYNANPVSAAAGTATLEIVENSDACARANRYAAELRAGLNEILAAERVPWAAHGTFSGFHIFLNPRNRPLDPARFDPFAIDYREMVAVPAPLAQKVRLALLVNGVDVMGRLAGFVSATHGKDEMAATLAAFRGALAMLRAEGELPRG
jgi:glutamate-1-semialdehyde 2,1-aminomutase